MTNEELAIHWHLPLKEVKQISNIINYLYFVDLVSERQADQDVWEAILYANDGKRDYVLMEEGKKFSDKDQAIIQGTKWAQNIKMTKGQAGLMGVPTDAFLILHPIKGHSQALERQYYPSKKFVHSTRQHD